MEVQKNEVLWEQKYRPGTINDCILTPALRALLAGMVAKGDLSNMLLCSKSPGTGKTTVARALANDLGANFMFINASEDNGIDVMRTKIRQYASSMSLTGGMKIVILDEADNMSEAAQKALRGSIEEFSSNCRFILTCNYKSKIIEPIRSRLLSVDFVIEKADLPAMAGAMFKRCCAILANEGVEFDQASVAGVIRRRVPDNRSVLIELQGYVNAHGCVDEGILGQLKAASVQEIYQLLKDKEFTKMRQWVEDNTSLMADDFYGRLYKSMDTFVVDQSKPELIGILGEEQKHHSTVPNINLHIAAMLTQIMVNVEFK